MSENRSLTAIVIDASGSEVVVAGVPLLLRAVLSAWRAGIGRVIVLCDGESVRARAILQRDARTRLVEIVTPDLIAGRVEEPVMVISADCLVTPRSVQAVAESATADRLVGLCTDDGATSTFAIAVGAGEHWSALFALMPGRGVVGQSLRLSSSVITAQARIHPYPAFTVHRVDPRLRGDGGIFVGKAPLTIASAPAIRVRDPADVRRAEDALIAELRAATRDTDGPIAQLDRALSLRLSRWLVRAPLRPNHITVIGTCTGLLAAWALAQGSYAFAVLGALLFWLAVIIDGCDGEVARLKFLESRFGHLFDVITDNIVHVAIFAGLAVGAHRAGRVQNVSLFAATLIAGFLCASAATYCCLLSDGPVKHLEIASARGRLRRRFLRFFEALMNRDFAYLLIALALIDRLHWFLWGTVFGTYAYALGLFWAYRLGDEGAPARGSAAPIRESPR